MHQEQGYEARLLKEDATFEKDFQADFRYSTILMS
jgi:hypothetical protein